ncbi:TPA: site-specific DNA-methyltransferase, partial [Patescibacteria group bacterium]|nr:site-specific DNA-methyltransferase [Patescibacteria group bacterium]
PFMGSGTTALSAINFKRDYIGIDISPEYCEMARKRIKQHQAQVKLW